eukprot:GHVU01234285.1.p1 GENE.GHVU01234285.1~~GHVU01234285.1.p1  ORF type:complete len:158 (+),score=27.43 GHVU01234285.1:43-474(+)
MANEMPAETDAVAEAHTMAGEAERKGMEARKAEAVGEVIGDYQVGGTGYEYRGQVRDNKPHGLGVAKRLPPDGTVYYEGEWQNGYRHGLGVNRFGDGKIAYAGQRKGDRWHGLGVKWNSDGKEDYAGWWNIGERSQTPPPENG